MFKFKKTFIFMILAVIIAGGLCMSDLFSEIASAMGKPVKKEKDGVRETALFKYDAQKKEIALNSEKIKEYINIKFVSVTTDQPIYWPNEDVNIRVAAPVAPMAEVSVTLTKKDSTPRDIGKLKLNDGGILVSKILSGSEKKSEAGEYTVSVKSEDGKINETASFSVVEGHLGAVSFAYEFEQLTNAEALKEVKGGWFLGNAEGVGKRWGNGLNVKNEVRVLNQPYTGVATVKSRCYLPGCNGCEAGAEIKTAIKNGLLEAVMEVGGHSGPFEIEVVTPKGEVRNLFGRSGHVERQITKVSHAMTNYFNATLAPYEGTQPVSGREIYIEKAPPVTGDPLELESVICDLSNKVYININKDMTEPKAFVCGYDEKGQMKTKEITLEKKLSKGKKLEIECGSPYSFIAFAGFLETDDKKDKKSGYFESWALVFTQSPISAEITAPETRGPEQECEIVVRTSDKKTNAPVSVYGIIEAFDNRVAAKAPKEPLVSSIGDSFRGLSNYITSWSDWTGYDNDEFEVSKSMEMDDGAAPMAPMPAAPAGMSTLFSVSPSMSKSKKMSAPKMLVGSVSAQDARGEEGKAPEEPSETIREGERKVVYCGDIKTDARGEAVVKFKMPPQTGRLKVRFTALNRFDYLEKVKEIDTGKKNYVEAEAPKFLTPGSKIMMTAGVVNGSGGKLKLNVTGACLEKDMSFDVDEGIKNVEFEIIGRNFGTLKMELSDGGGKALDKREFKISNIEAMPVSFSDVLISNGGVIPVEKGRKIAIYANPARLLTGMVKNMNTTMYSWFGHAEAISASAAIRAMILRALADKIITDDEGLRATLKSDLIKSVKDLNEKFYNSETGLVYPYPGVGENAAWTVWVLKNLSAAVNSLRGSEALKAEFSETITQASEMIEKMTGALLKKNISIQEYSMYDPEKKDDVVPVEIDGKVIYRATTDDAAIKFFNEKIFAHLDIGDSVEIKALNVNFIKMYDTYRFLRAFERTGMIYYMLLNAKALLVKNDPNFYKVFNVVAKGIVNTNEPGLIQGPALLGGVYGAPQTAVKFLDLLILMAKDSKIKPSVEVTITRGKGGKENVTAADSPVVMDVKDGGFTVSAPEFAVIRVDDRREVNLYYHLEKKAFFNAVINKNSFRSGEDGSLTVKLDADRDPSEYYAIIAMPSNLSIRQTDDILSDYKGSLLYGQKTAGGERIKLITAPFRGSREITVSFNASQKGESEGFVLVRHLGNPDEMVTVKTDKIKVE